MRILNILLISALLGASSALGIVKEIKAIEEAREYVFGKPHTIVCFDVDSTLLTTKNDGPGSLAWGSALMRYAIAHGVDVRGPLWHEFYEAGLKVYAYVHHSQQVEFTYIESETVTLVNKLQDKRIPALVLTARPHDWYEDTVRELMGAGFDFSKSVFGQTQIYLDLPFGKALLAHGMLLAGSNTKASVLGRFLEISNYCAQRVVCIDDERKPLEELDALFASRPDIEFIGLRYGFLDEKVRTFTLDESTIPQEFKDIIARAQAAAKK